MFDITRPDAGFVAVVTIELSRPDAVEPLLELLVREVDDWVKHQAGFVSANYHVSLDTTRVLNYAQWTSEEAYKESFSKQRHSVTLREAITAIPGVDSLGMVGYTLEQSVAAAEEPVET
jgi:C-6 monooxygenase